MPAGVHDGRHDPGVGKMHHAAQEYRVLDLKEIGDARANTAMAHLATT
jgi:hypothetical protein